MLATSAIAIFLIAWSAVFLIDYVLRVAHFEPYLRLSNRFGIEVSPFQLKFYVTPHATPSTDKEALLKEHADEKKNDLFQSDESRRLKCRRLFIRIWFSLGVLASVVCLFGMTIYMSHLLMKDVGQWMSTRPKVAALRGGMEYRSMHHVLLGSASPIVETTTSPQEMHENPVIVDEEYDMIEDGQKTSRGLVPIIPGFNLPWAHIPVFMAVLVIAAVFHELGHAWAATSNGVTVNGFGIFILAVYPGAFTDIEPFTLKRASPFRRLQVFGAGIWHNLLLALLAFGLFHISPYLVSPVLAEGNGVSVKGVDGRSGLANARTGLLNGDVVVNVDECRVETREDWWKCIREARESHNGRCVDREAVEAATAFNTRTEADEILCCDEFNVTTAHVCFEREEIVANVETQTRAPQLNALLGLEESKKGAESDRQTEQHTETKYSCLHARHVVQQAACNASNPCSSENSEDVKDSLGSGEKVCVYPALRNGTHLVKIGLANRNKPVLFVGHLNEMLEMVSISALTPRFSFATISWLEHVELFAKYLFTLSLALGLFNAMPVYCLDGQFIVQTLLKSTGLHWRRRELFQYLILTFGTAILALNIFIGFVKLAIN